MFNKTHKNNINSKLTYRIFASHCALFSVILASIIALVCTYATPGDRV